MRIWFDADNAPHVLVMKPLAEELVRRGHEVFFTARGRSSTCGLLDLYGLKYILIGGSSAKSMKGKMLSTLGRAAALARVARRMKPHLSFGHGSRALPLASRLGGIQTITMYDYEWVDHRIFNRFCKAILLPEAIDNARAAEAGIAVDKIRYFPGLKEEIYLSNWRPDPSVAVQLGLEASRTKALLRPPAFAAHYHNPESEVIYSEILELLLRRDDLQIILIPREGQPALPVRSGRATVITPPAAVDGPSLIWHMDLVIGGGGTMTREAAVLGIPAISFFRGRPGRVDERLHDSGRLRFFEGGHADSLEIGKRVFEPAIPEDRGLVGKVARLLLQ